MSAISFDAKWLFLERERRGSFFIYICRVKMFVCVESGWEESEMLVERRRFIEGCRRANAIIKIVNGAHFAFRKKKRN